VALWVSWSKWIFLDANKLLTITSNDLVKAVAAVNKNVIVVGECRVEYNLNFRSSLLTTCLTLNSSQRRTNHPRINSVKRQCSSNCLGWVSRENPK
jgi:hypothetical protein